MRDTTASLPFIGAAIAYASQGIISKRQDDRDNRRREAAAEAARQAALDETRRLLLMARIAVEAGQAITPELGATIYNAIAYRHTLVSAEEGLVLVAELCNVQIMRAQPADLVKTLTLLVRQVTDEIPSGLIRRGLEQRSSGGL